MSGANPTYNHYLKSAEWRKKRDAAMSRAGGTCEMCEQRTATQVHHIRYPKRLGDEPLTDLLAVCRQCHEKGHGMIEHQRNEMVLTFEGTGIRSVVLDDSSPLFVWEDVEAAIFREGHERRAAVRSRADLKAQMREARHWETKDRVDYLTEVGIYRWAQIFPRPSVWRDDQILVRFSDWMEDLCKSIREGKVAIVQMDGARGEPHPDLMQVAEVLLAQMRIEHQKNTQQDEQIAGLDTRVAAIETSSQVARDPGEFITIRRGCMELAVDPDELVKGKLGLAAVVGNRMAELARERPEQVPRGDNRPFRLPDSGVITNVATYKRLHVHTALKRHLGRA